MENKLYTICKVFLFIRIYTNCIKISAKIRPVLEKIALICLYINRTIKVKNLATPYFIEPVIL